MKRKTIRRMVVFVVLVVLLSAGIFAFINQPSFGRQPQGARLERIKQSPNYRDGEFRNRDTTALLTSGRSRWRTMLGFLTRSSEGLRPEMPIAAVKSDLHALDPARELIVWFGHSSYLIQSGGKRVLVDPVFRKAAPVGFVNKPFEGTNIYKPEDMPDIDFLVITHDHWDHLDYWTVRELKERIGAVVCPLGVGEHFERWGFDPARIVELDWDESRDFGGGITFNCLPARHFSGRGPKPNQTLWASFLLETPSRRIFMGGDGGYGSHFTAIGARFEGIDLAILENGQYNEDWKYIHTMPEYLTREASELGARRVMTVHHSKYALARHRWDEPLENERRMAECDSVDVLIPVIGVVTDLNN